MNQEDSDSSSSTTHTTTTSSELLRNALFTFHRFHTSFSLDNEQANVLQQARDVINSVSVDVLSTPFLLEDNQDLRDAFYHEDDMIRSASRYNAICSFIFAGGEEDEEEESPKMVLPIHLAALLGNGSIVNFFLKRYREGKSSLDECGGRIPLVYAIVGGCIDIVKLLINIYPEGVSRTIDTDEQNEYTSTTLPIHIAATYSNAEIIQLLLEASPDTVSQKDNDNNLPLHRAIITGNEFCVKLLVDNYPEGVKSKDLLFTPLTILTIQLLLLLSLQ